MVTHEEATRVIKPPNGSAKHIVIPIGLCTGYTLANHVSAAGEDDNVVLLGPQESQW